MPSWLHHAIAQSSTSICTVKCTGGEAVHTQSVFHCSAKGSPSDPLSMNFWKSSKGGEGGVISDPKNFVAIFLH